MFQRCKWASGSGLPCRNIDPPARAHLAIQAIADPTLPRTIQFAFENMSLVFAKANVWGCQGGEGAFGVPSGVRDEESWRERNPTLDGGCYLIYPISMGWGVEAISVLQMRKQA